MRHTIVVLALSCCAMALGGCGGGNSLDADWRDGTHNERTYYPMSMPAFLPDGSKFVINGSQLLKFSADDAPLDSIELPIDLEHVYTSPQVISTAGGNVFALLGDGRVGLLNAAGQFEWLQEYGARDSHSLAFGGGLLARCFDTTSSKMQLIGSDGQIKFELPLAKFLVDSDATATSGYAYLLAERRLWVADTTGAWVLQNAPVGDLASPEFLDAAAGRILLCDRAHRGSLYCCDQFGSVLWSAQLPDGFDYPIRGIMCHDGSALVPVARNTGAGYQYIVQAYDAQGHPQTLFDGLQPVSVSRWDQDHFAAQLIIGTDVHFALLANTGELVWAVPRPALTLGWNASPGEDRISYSHSSEVLCGADQRIYFERDSTLYALDAQGNIVWREAGHEYIDKRVPNSGGPGSTPETGGTGTGGPKPSPAGSGSA